MRRRLPIVIVLLVVAAVAVGAWIWWRGIGGSTATTLGGSGTVEATEVQIASLVGGRITSVEATEGDTVQAGDVLFTIDAQLLKQQVAAAQAGVTAAQAGVSQAEDNGTSAEVDVAKARVEQAKAQLRAVQVQLGYATVTAPTAGTVTVLAATAGENATPGRSLATLADLTRLTVSVFIPETQIGQIRIGDTARVTTDSSTQTFTGRVAFIASQAEFTPSNVETKEQRVKLVYEVRLDLSGTAGVLKPGMPVDVSFE